MNNRPFRPVAWVFVAVVPLAGLQRAVAIGNPGDCNRNGIPDDCDVNCGLSGCLQHACAPSDEISPNNGVPDECEGAPAMCTFTETQGDCQLLISDGVAVNMKADLDGPSIKMPGDSSLNSTKGMEL